jgi:O-antigen ligase
VWLQPSTVYDRLLTWRDAFGAFVDNPLFGVGTGAYRHIVHSGFTIYHADSLPLTVLAEMGIAGLAAFGVLAFAIYANVQATSNPARWGVFAFGIMCLVDAPLYAPLVAMLFGLMLAQLEYVPVVEVPVKFPATTIHELAEVE